MTQEDLNTSSLDYEEQMPSHQHNWDEGGGWRDGMLATAYEAGFKKALELVLSNDMITEVHDCETVEQLLNWLH